MTNDLQLIHERVDDIPLLYGVMEKLHMSELLDHQLGNHGLHQGVSNGQLAVIWLMYILSEGDHRKSGVQDWVDRHRRTLEKLLGQPLRAGIEANDERLGIVLQRLSKDEAWERLEAALWTISVAVYRLELDGVRLDSTTTYGYHAVGEDGLMQFGHSKDHRPDLPQVKLMAAAAEPSGQLLACDMVSGERADDRLYTPLIQRVRQMVSQAGLLYTGDCKMASLATRSEIADHGDYYLTSLPMTGETAVQFEGWVEAALSGKQNAQLIRVDGQILGDGYEFERILSAQVGEETLTWTERVQIFRSLALAKRQAETLEQRLVQAETELKRLTPLPGRGKRQFQEEAGLQFAIQQVLEHHQVTGLLQVAYQREERTQTRLLGRGRPGPNRPMQTVSQVRYVITQVRRDENAILEHKDRLGWRNHITNLPPERMSLSQSVAHYRGGWVLENDFHLLKDRPLGISPLFVRLDDQILGLTRLLTLALRVLTLIQTQVRSSLQQTGEVLVGLYEGHPHRTTDQPTATRMLKAVSRQETTLTRVVMGQQSFWYLTPLTDFLVQVLKHLDVLPSVYLRLVDNSP
jgi:transposase